MVKIVVRQLSLSTTFCGSEFCGSCTAYVKESVPRLLTRQLYNPVCRTCVHTAAPNTAPKEHTELFTAQPQLVLLIYLLLKYQYRHVCCVLDTANIHHMVKQQIQFIIACIFLLQKQEVTIKSRCRIIWTILTTSHNQNLNKKLQNYTISASLVNISTTFNISTFMICQVLLPNYRVFIKDEKLQLQTFLVQLISWLCFVIYQNSNQNCSEVNSYHPSKNENTLRTMLIVAQPITLFFCFFCFGYW